MGGIKDMARYNAMEEQFEEITLLGKPALFTSIRLERDSVPKGLYLYEVRGDDDGCGDPVQIARGILVNHFGSIITREPIKLPPDGYLDIEWEKDWNFAGGDCRTVKEFQETYPPVKKKEKEQER
ncbi:LPD28 domain-containing protein [Dorea sp. YH-dor228]